MLALVKIINVFTSQGNNLHVGTVIYLNYVSTSLEENGGRVCSCRSFLTSLDNDPISKSDHNTVRSFVSDHH
jgi:hypothetical protein